MQQLNEAIQTLLAAQPRRLILSKPRPAAQWRRVEVRRLETGWQLACYTDTQVFHENLDPDAFGPRLEQLAAAYGQRIAEQLALHGVGPVYLLLHAGVHFLPEARHGAHARGVGLAHGVLHLERVGVHYEPGSHGEAEQRPPFLEDVGIGQEVHHAVVLANVDAAAVGLEGGVVLPVGQYHALAVAGGAAGVEYVGHVVVRRCGVEALQLLGVGVVLAQPHEVVEIERVGVVGAYAHRAVEDDDALQRGAEGEHAVGLVVLLLLAHEEQAHAGVVDHELYLLLAARGIEGYGHGPYAPGTEVGVDVLHAVLGEHAYVLLHAHAELEQRCRHLADRERALAPRARHPLLAAELPVYQGFAVAVLLGLVVYQHRQVTVCLHNHIVLLALLCLKGSEPCRLGYAKIIKLS